MVKIPQFQRIDISDLFITDPEDLAVWQKALNILNPFMEDLFRLTENANKPGGSNFFEGLLDTDIVTATRGDVLVFDGEFWKNLAVGTQGQVLTVDFAASEDVAWKDSGDTDRTLFVSNVVDPALSPQTIDSVLQGLKLNSDRIFEVYTNISPFIDLLVGGDTPANVYGHTDGFVAKYSGSGQVLWSFGITATIKDMVLDNTFLYIVADWDTVNFTIKRFSAATGAENPLDSTLEAITDIDDFEVVAGSEFYFSSFSAPNLVLEKFDDVGVSQWTESNTLGPSQILKSNGDGSIFSAVREINSPFRKINQSSGNVDYSVNLTGAGSKCSGLRISLESAFITHDSTGKVTKVQQSDGLVNSAFGWQYDVSDEVLGLALNLDEELYYFINPAKPEIQNISRRGVLNFIKQYDVQIINDIELAPQIGQFRSLWLAAPSLELTPTPTPSPVPPTPTPSVSVTPTSTPPPSVTPTVTPTPSPVVAAFESEWDTTITTGGAPPFNILRLPLVATGTYNFNVDWGDGSGIDNITVWNQAEVTHTYVSGGIKNISITGTIKGWNFESNQSERLKLLDITQWGVLQFVDDATLAFHFCLNMVITATDVPNISNVTIMERMFQTCLLITGIANMGDWDVSSVTNMQGLFQDASLFNTNLNNWDTGAVLNMRDVFRFAAAYDQPMDNWDTGSVTTMFGMFRNASIFDQDLSGWNTGQVVTMEEMFKNASLFASDISSWTVSSVQTFISMFEQADLFNAPIGSWNMVAATSIASMFFAADIFNQPLIWNTGNITDMSGAFNNTPAFDQDISSWVVVSLTTAQDMFKNNSISTANYNALLIGWEAQSVLNFVQFHGGSSTFNAGAPATARAALISDHFWSFTDGGQV